MGTEMVFDFKKRDCTTCIYFQRYQERSHFVSVAFLLKDRCMFKDEYLDNHDACNCWIDKEGNEA